KPTNIYSSKVLVGPWVNERAEAAFVPEVYKHSISTYRDSYGAKPPSGNDPSIIWDQKLNAEESNFVSQIGRNDFPNYFENFSSTYDLSYNHFPKCYRGYIPRTLRFRLGRFEPDDHYILTFGNLTKYGLLDYKKEQWACERQDPRQTYSTNYRDAFTSPEMNDYKFQRFAIPLQNSSRMDEVNVLMFNLKLRDRSICNVPANYNLVTVPVKKTCNPITWECALSEKPAECCKKCI
ncbi:uncharacterized protein BDFB_005326, partial [Asbolus verrucosus]